MKRLNIRFYDDIYEKLEVRTKEKNCGSVVQSVRELVDLGFKIEESAKQNNGDEARSDGLTFLVDVMKSNLKWSLETLLIIRFMMNQLSEDNQLDTEELLKKCKEQALSHVKKIFPETEK